jgi:acyl-CoA synthetase (AMP-forming)/AMP-acid ligase II
MTIPDVTLTHHVLRHAERLADKPALIDGPSGRGLTYGQLCESVERAAAGLARRGFGKGDVLAIYSPNLPEYGVAFLAAASRGGVVTTINPLYTAHELAGQLTDSQARLLVTVPACLDRAKEAVCRSSVESIFVFGRAEGAESFAALLAAGDRPPLARIDPREDLVALPYSSGTTGLPKGVMLTHRNLVANLCQCEEMEGFEGVGERDVVMGVLPFFHIYGLEVGMLQTLAVGATIVATPRFDLEEFLRLVQTHRVTVLPVVPPILLAMAKHPAAAIYDLSSLRLVLSAAAPLGEDLARALGARLGCPVVQGYGMTESAGATHLSPTHGAPLKPGSVGRIVPATEVRIVDVGAGVDVVAGQAGELWIRGPQIMRGYLHRPEETAACLDRDGWYHTGDVGYADEEGDFFIVDRTKELIKYKGLQVAPAELEALLLTHPAVLDAAVVRAPDTEAGEVPKAFVVLKPEEASGSAMTARLTGWVAERVAPHKRIRQLEFIDRIPRSATGKILRRVLMEEGARAADREIEGRR